MNNQPARYPRIGEILADRYELLELLDQGGMGMVMRARQIAVDRDVAIKLLRPDRSGGRDRARFQREVHLATQLDHPHVVRYFDIGEHNGLTYIVMELLRGEDLSSRLKRLGPLPVGTAITIAKHTLDALVEAHRSRIVHRDLKPPNIFLQQQSRGGDFVKVLDFGVAKSMDSQDFDVTKTGHVSGTVNYVAPEAILGRPIDSRSDLYAVGLILVEMLLGVRAFTGSTVTETMMMHMRVEVPIPPFAQQTRLQAILLKATAKRPEERYQSATAFMEDLELVRSELDPMLRCNQEDVEAAFEARSYNRQSLLAEFLGMGGEVNDFGTSAAATPVPAMSAEMPPPIAGEGLRQAPPSAPPPPVVRQSLAGPPTPAPVEGELLVTSSIAGADVAPFEAGDTARTVRPLSVAKRMVGSPGAPYFLAGGLSLMLLVGASLMLMGPGKQQQPDPEVPVDAYETFVDDEPRAEADGEFVMVQTTPEGADLYFGGRPRYTTPARVFLASKETWEVRKTGFETQMIVLRPGGAAVSLELVATAAPKAAPSDDTKVRARDKRTGASPRKSSKDKAANDDWVDVMSPPAKTKRKPKKRRRPKKKRVELFNPF